MENSVKNSDNPRLYVGTYAKYNNGSLFGEWVDLTDFSDSEAFYDYCRELHKDESDPEFMFQDCENIPDSLYSESGNINEIYEWIDRINEVESDGYDREAYEAFCSHFGETSVSAFKDSYQGEYKSEIDYVEQFLEDTGMLNEIPESLRYYFDYERYARDVFASDCVFIDGYVFNCNW